MNEFGVMEIETRIFFGFISGGNFWSCRLGSDILVVIEFGVWRFF